MDIYFERIKPLFDESGMTVKEIAAAIGCSYRDIYHWNKDGLKSYTKYLYKIAEVFNVNVEYLRGETDIKEKAATQEGNGYSDTVREIIDLVSPLTEDQQKWILARLQDSLAALKALDGLR